jgi:TolB-like protein
VTLVTVFLLIGFPLVLVFTWAYEITPEGIKKEKDVERSESITRETAKKLDIAVIVLLILAMGGLVVDRLIPDATTPATEATADNVAVTSAPDQSIAILPFADMSPEGDQEYFSDGISEELLNVLAKIPGLRVVARTSSFQFKGENRDIIDIGQRLNVAHILEGSVRKSGNKLRITAQLIKADDGFHLWSESYDRDLDDIFAVQEEIATAIIGALKVELALVAGEAVRPTVIQAANTAAYEAYLLGRELIRLRGRQNLEAAVRHLERSLSLDERFAPAHAQLAIGGSVAKSYSAPGSRRGA